LFVGAVCESGVDWLSLTFRVYCLALTFDVFVSCKLLLRINRSYLVSGGFNCTLMTLIFYDLRRFGKEAFPKSEIGLWGDQSTCLKVWWFENYFFNYETFFKSDPTIFGLIACWFSL